MRERYTAFSGGSQLLTLPAFCVFVLFCFRFLPEFHLYVECSPELAGELTRKESGFISEILTLAALQAGKNVLLDGSLRDADWYAEYFERLRGEFKSLRLAIIQVTAPRDVVFARAAVSRQRIFSPSRMVRA